MIRVVLPVHLRNLAGVGDEVQLTLEREPTIGALIDALEDGYPQLRGTIRDRTTQKRRPLVRFFACGEDLSHEAPDVLLPLPIAQGADPFFIVGAMAGG